MSLLLVLKAFLTKFILWHHHVVEAVCAHLSEGCLTLISHHLLLHGRGQVSLGRKLSFLGVKAFRVLKRNGTVHEERIHYIKTLFHLSTLQKHVRLGHLWYNYSVLRVQYYFDLGKAGLRRRHLTHAHHRIEEVLLGVSGGWLLQTSEIVRIPQLCISMRIGAVLTKLALVFLFEVLALLSLMIIVRNVHHFHDYLLWQGL